MSSLWNRDAADHICICHVVQHSAICLKTQMTKVPLSNSFTQISQRLLVCSKEKSIDHVLKMLRNENWPMSELGFTNVEYYSYGWPTSAAYVFELNWGIRCYFMCADRRHWILLQFEFYMDNPRNYRKISPAKTRNPIFGSFPCLTVSSSDIVCSKLFWRSVGNIFLSCFDA